jgi:uncharacterized membrane protein
MDTATPTTPAPVTSEDKTVAVLSYLTLIGFIVAIVMHSSKKTKLGAFHLRQVLGFFIASVVGGICVAIVCVVLGLILAFIIKFLAVVVVWLIYVGFFISLLVLWIMGLMAALKGEMKPMPVVGPLFQKWFGNMFE